MSLLDLLSPERRRTRGAWLDPVRRIRTLESFSRTEADGGRDIAAAARRAHDPELRAHLERHAQDEVRHAELFRTRAMTLRETTPIGAGAEAQADKLFTLGRERSDVNAHGFLNASLFDELGEVNYVAMLHLAERRAASVFTLHHGLLAHDPDTAAIFQQILKDEKYHVAYTATILDKWRKEGRSTEVKAALAQAKGSRFMAAWKRMGVRAGAGFGRVVLFLLYWTLFLPVGLIARSGARARGWSRRAAPRFSLRSQY